MSEILYYIVISGCEIPLYIDLLFGYDRTITFFLLIIVYIKTVKNVLRFIQHPPSQIKLQYADVMFVDAFQLLNGLLMPLNVVTSEILQGLQLTET